MLSDKENTMIKASIKAKLSKEKLSIAYEDDGLIGVYDLGMEHMYDYLKESERK